jgi:ribonuclease P protein subunit POP4
VKGKGYEINKKNILNHELIGLKVKIVESTDPKRIGAKGKIIDETKNTFVLEDGKVIPKHECVFEFDIGEKISVKGKDIEKKPEDRLK